MLDPRSRYRRALFRCSRMSASLPALLARIDVAALRAGAAEVMDVVLAAQTAADAPPALGAAIGGWRLPSITACRRHRDDALCRPARAFRPVVPTTLGRKPRQGWQGHAADPRARRGRPAQPVAALPRRARRQDVHHRHHRRGRRRCGGRAPTSRAIRRLVTSPASRWATCSTPNSARPPSDA